MKAMRSSHEANVKTAARGNGRAAAAHKPAVAGILRKLRTQRGLSMNQLSIDAGVSAGMISQIERGMANPSIKILERLRVALNVPLSVLVERSPDNEIATPRDPAGAQSAQLAGRRTDAVAVPLSETAFVRRLHDRPKFNVGVAPLRKELLSPPGMENMQFMIIHFPPFAPPEDVVQGPGQKAGLVLGGEVHLVVDGTDTLLREGDSFQFDSTCVHSIRNDSDTEAHVVWIMASFKTAHF
jgi:transcriptional regulator with XRE-family HTH domain